MKPVKRVSPQERFDACLGLLEGILDRATTQREMAILSLAIVNLQDVFQEALSEAYQLGHATGYSQGEVDAYPPAQEAA